MARILIIDDDPQMRRIMALILVRAGHEMLQARNGKDGIREFHSHHPDCVVTDILMEGKDGIETICEIRREAPEVPIIAISGGGRYSGGPTLLDMAIKLGADAALTKPFHAAELLETVDRLLDAAILELPARSA